jgi:glycosyltransferase involved in cell wall biosynthesis
MARLVFHVPSLVGGGAERVWVLMANEMAARGHEVTLLVWNAEGPNARLRSEAVRLVDFGMPIVNEGFGKRATIDGLLRMAGFLRHHRPDAVYSAPEFANLVMALALILSRSKARFFPSVHSAASIPRGAIGSQIAVALSALLAKRATRFIAVSGGVARDLEARGLPPGKVAVINNPLPPGLDGLPGVYPWQQRLAAMGGGPVIASAGRLTPVKDQATLLRAFARLAAERPARLVLFGDGPLRAELESLAASLGLAGRVLFPGYVNDPAACYAAADLFVLSSISEGFGNVLIEAMAAGVPVVSTDCLHGPREILGDGRFGPLAPVGDDAALAEAMAEALDHPVSSALLRARAAEFEVGRIGERYAALLLA